MDISIRKIKWVSLFSNCRPTLWVRKTSWYTANYFGILNLILDAKLKPHVHNILLFSCSVVSNSLWPHWLQHARFPHLSPSPRACLNSCLLNWWCHPTISSSVVPFSFCLQSFPASGSFLMSQLFASGGQNIGACFNISPSDENSGLISFMMDWFDSQSKGLSRVFSNTTVQKHQFFGAQPSLWSNSQIHTWLLEKP